MAGPRIVVAMSGGVDSSVAAALLRDAGYRVEGVSLRLWDSARRDDRVCSDHRDAGRVAEALGIPHSVVDERAAFERAVVRPFVEAYAAGTTPNPCVTCNGEFKLGSLLERALARGADVVATGHYARVKRRGDAFVLRRGRDGARDQSYFLFALTRRQLARVVFPLGEWTKAEVRRRAAELGLPTADKAESQDLCFGDPARLVQSRGEGGRAGDVVDDRGERLGGHGGIERFTIGQRRGLGIAAAEPLYVRALDRAAARVVVGRTPPRSASLLATGWNWIGEPPAADEQLAVQVRYRQPPLAGRVAPVAPGRVRVDFEHPALAVAPGQAVVVYRGDEVVGGGWIAEAALAAGAP